MFQSKLKYALALLLVALLTPAAWATTYPSNSVVIRYTAQGSTGYRDNGSITISFNGFSETAPVGVYTTPAAIAAYFGAWFSQDPLSALPRLCTRGVCAKAGTVTSSGAPLNFQLSSGSFGPITVTSSTNAFMVDTSNWSTGSGALSVTCSPSSIPAGYPTSCTAQVAAGSSGSVDFSVDTVYSQTVPVSADGSATAPQLLANASTGSHTVTATYAAAGGATTTANATVTVTADISGNTTVYSYSVAGASGNSGYAANGNVIAYTDSVNGNWSLGYDNLNRLTSSAPLTTGSNYGCWTYDHFGNRTGQILSNQAFAVGSPTCQPPSGAVWSITQEQFTGTSNRITSGSWMNPQGSGFNSGSPSYDSAGNMTNDLQNTYLYDSEGRVCAMQTLAGTGTMTGYLYNAEGQRVAKGSITTMSCDMSNNGFQATSIYVIGPDGQEMTQVDGSGNWVHTNVSVAGEMIATYANDGNGVHFHLSDWLGTRRVQTTYAGMAEDLCQSLPFGDVQTCSSPGSDVSTHHFTAKERDTESGLDYFGARYYGSSMGRFLSPDPSGMAFTSLSNPQSFNMYSYVQNNPLNSVDPDGLDCVYVDNDSGQVTGFNRGDCDNSTDAKANSGYYFNGTVSTLYTTTGDLSGQLVGVQGTSDDTGGQLYQANPAGTPFAQPNGSTSTSGMDTTINTFGDYSQTTQFNHGTHPFRDNNPGDITAGPFTSRNGQLGTDGRFAVFPGAGTGRQALDTLLRGGAYFNLSINAAVAKYAPSMENNTAGYQQFLTNVLGVSGNTPLSSLSPAQFQKLEGAIASEEGFNARGNYSISVTTNF